ncbi:HET-domain-containing protein, partial [Aaosphaeria arxii CBS 175.79]
MYNIIVETVPIERFVYRPIDLTRKSIRLLRIIRGDCGLIKCELFDAWLEDDGGIIEYEALSYTWGGSEKLHMVIINDKPFQVTANLSQALQDLRNPDKDRILWIDAICIDQDNDPERGHQVQQMSLIYKRADRVIVWLGPSSSSTGRAFDHMQRLEEKAADYAYNNWTTSDERWLEIWNKLHSDMAIEPSSILPFIRSDLASLLRRPWFERVWIIQEVANAKSGRVVCGDRSVSIRIFAVFPTLMDIALDVQCQSIIDVMPGSTRKYSWWAKKHDLHTLLVKFRGSKASDPRDKIYALLGISSDISGMDTLTADYEKSLQEIIHDTAFYLL